MTLRYTLLHLSTPFLKKRSSVPIKLISVMATPQGLFVIKIFVYITLSCDDDVISVTKPSLKQINSSVTIWCPYMVIITL